MASQIDNEEVKFTAENELENIHSLASRSILSNCRGSSQERKGQSAVVTSCWALRAIAAITTIAAIALGL